MSTTAQEFYFLSPVEVMKVTRENLDAVAEWCGGAVAEVESQRNPGRMVKYVWVPTPKGNATSSAFPNMYITKRVVVTLKDEFKITYAVFRKEYFERNYFTNPAAAVDLTWGAKDGKKKVNVPKPITELSEGQKKALEIGKTGNKGRRNNVEPVVPKSPAEQREAIIEETIEAIVEAESRPTPKLGEHDGRMKMSDVLKMSDPLVEPEIEEMMDDLTTPFYLVHNHGVGFSCDASGCKADRYVDGVHEFSDGKFITADIPKTPKEEIVEAIKARPTIVEDLIETLADNVIAQASHDFEDQPKENSMTETPEVEETEEEREAKRIPNEVLYTTPIDESRNVPVEGATFPVRTEVLGADPEGDAEVGDAAEADGGVPVASEPALTERQQQLADKTDDQLQSLLDRKKITEEEFLFAISDERRATIAVIPELVVEPSNHASGPAMDYNAISTPPLPTVANMPDVYESVVQDGVGAHTEAP